MDSEDIEKRKSALSTILLQMDVPKNNCIFQGPRTIRNLRWLTRNLAINNKDHLLFEAAMTLIKTILKSS